MGPFSPRDLILQFPETAMRFFSASLALWIGLVAGGTGAFGTAPVHAQALVDADMTQRLVDEGLNRSQALDLFHTLTDVYGARLTGSPEYDRAAEWARDRFAEWGLSDARLEPFEFGRGWTLQKLSAEMTEPRYMPLNAHAEAWTPSMGGVVEGPVVYVGDMTADDVRSIAASLRGAIVLTHHRRRAFATKTGRSRG